MFFAIVCHDRPGAELLRGEHLPQHLRYLEAQHSMLRTGGPLKHPETGSLVGSLYIIDAADYAAAQDFIKNEPLNRAGVFESLEIRGWMQMQPEITPGANELTAQELERQLQESHA